MSKANFKIGQEVIFKDASGVCVIVDIKGGTATVTEKSTGFIYKKRLTSLMAYVSRQSYWTEQELTMPVYEHGQVIFGSISGDGKVEKIVWDENKKQCVEYKDFKIK